MAGVMALFIIQPYKQCVKYSLLSDYPGEASAVNATRWNVQKCFFRYYCPKCQATHSTCHLIMTALVSNPNSTRQPCI